MVRAMCGVQLKEEMIYTFDVYVGVAWNHRSVGHGKQCSLVWSCVEKRWRSFFEKVIRLRAWRTKEERKAKEDMEKQVEVKSVKIGLRREDEHCLSKWSVGIKRLLLGWGQSGYAHLMGILLDFKHWRLSIKHHLNNPFLYCYSNVNSLP